MAAENPLTTWYVGEQKLLRWTVRDRQRRLVPVTGWNVTLDVFRRRQAAAVMSLTVEIDPLTESTLTSLFTAEATRLLGAGSYRYVLSRIDAGAEQVLAAEDIVLNRVGA